jgi:hypothetical protein
MQTCMPRSTHMDPHNENQILKLKHDIHTLQF